MRTTSPARRGANLAPANEPFGSRSWCPERKTRLRSRSPRFNSAITLTCWEMCCSPSRMRRSALIKRLRKRGIGRSAPRSGSKRARRRGPHQTSTGSSATAAEPSCKASSALPQSISCTCKVLAQPSSAKIWHRIALFIVARFVGRGTPYEARTFLRPERTAGRMNVQKSTVA
jgi:hypothetical protein